MKTEWRNAVDFAEVAETVKVPTTSILGMISTPGAELPELRCLYTKPAEYDALKLDAPVYAAALDRDADGILVAGPETVVSNLLRELEARLAEELGPDA